MIYTSQMDLARENVQSNIEKKQAGTEEVDSDATESYYGSVIEERVAAVTSVRNVEGVRDVETVECPVCGVKLPQYAIDMPALVEMNTLNSVASVGPIWIE